MPRLHQFTLRALLVAMLAAACFFGGIRFERERQRREDEWTAWGQFVGIAVIDPSAANRVETLLQRNGIEPIIEGSVVYGVAVLPGQEQRALSLLRADAAAGGYWIQTE